MEGDTTISGMCIDGKLTSTKDPSVVKTVEFKTPYTKVTTVQ